MANVIPLLAQPDPLAELQKRFCLIKLGGEVRVVDLEELAAIGEGTFEGDFAYFKRAEAKLLMHRHLESLAVSSDPNRVVADFLVDTNTLVYDAVAFSPLHTSATTLNFWNPSPVVPAQGDWSVIEEFLLNDLCDGDVVVYDFLRNFLAHMLQKPEEKPGVMIVMLGGEGIGKGTFLTLPRALWPRTTLHVSDVDHVVGGFNASLERNYVVCMDEAIFRGDRKALDRLKSLVTERQITIEAKYEPRRTIQSFHRFIAASNHEHFAQIRPDDRRFLFLRVSEAHKEDYAYWGQVHAAINDPTVIAAMAHDLLAIDLTGFNVRRRPKTAEHTQQKIQSLDGFDQYWYEVLSTSSIDASGYDPWDKGRFVDTSTLRLNCMTFNKSVRQYRPLTDQDIRQAVNRWCPAAAPARRKCHGLKQQRGYDLPSLHEAREAFAVAIGSAVEWHDAAEISAQPHGVTS